MPKAKGAYYALAVLFAINTMNFFDRQVIGAAGEPIRKEFELSDTALGWLGTAFILIYAAVGLPLGRLSDRFQRTKILAVGVFFWSLMTATSGMARRYWEMWIYRLGVGIGEASCAPAATSLIGDLVPAARRAMAMSIFMMGLPVGLALSFLVTGQIIERFDWRVAFYVAAVPGLLCAIAVLFVREPLRGATEVLKIGNLQRPGSPFRLVLSIPTMRWIIVSGALHNFNMYALGSFLMPFLMRVHEMQPRDAGLAVSICYGFVGIPGLILGGWLGDKMLHRMPSGRMLVGTLSIALSVPLVFLAFGQPKDATFNFVLLLGIGCGLMYTYYSTVYSTIHDVIEPSLRGTAMAVYFFAMYLAGASLGPVITGGLSDYFTIQAAQQSGVTELTSQAALEPFRGTGLHKAFYVVPFGNLLLGLVLFAASRTVSTDMRRLSDWMREAVNQGATQPGEVDDKSR